MKKGCIYFQSVIDFFLKNEIKLNKIADLISEVTKNIVAKH